MGILDGLLSPALTVATQAAGTQQMAQAQEAERHRAEAIQSAMLMRQLNQEQNMEQYHNAMSRAADARARRYDQLTKAGPRALAPKFLQGQGGEWYRMDPETNEAIPVQVGEVPPSAMSRETSGGVGGLPGLGAGTPAPASGGRVNAPGTTLQGHLPPPPPSYGQPVVTVDAQGNRTYGVPSHKTGDIKETTVQAPEPRGGLGGSQAPIGDMEQRYAEIEKHAQGLASNQWHMNRAMQYREGLEYSMANQSAGPGGKSGVPLKSAAIAGGMDWAQKNTGLMGLDTQDYPVYQQYMTAMRAFGDDAAKVFKGRQNEEAVKREIANMQFTPGDNGNHEVVARKLSRMRHIMDLARQTMPATRSIGQGGGTGTAGTATTGAATGTGVTAPPPAAPKAGRSGSVARDFGIKPSVP